MFSTRNEAVMSMPLAPQFKLAGSRGDGRHADGLLIKDNPDWEAEPRVPAGNPDGGQWTNEDGAEDADMQPAAAQMDETQARKERFVDAHLADTQETADRLGVPVENILGVSAIESGW